jgi:hypothetical protein
MDHQKYNDLRRKVVNNMFENSKRRKSGRRSSCPSLLIPSYFTKTFLTLEKDDLDDIQSYFIRDSQSPTLKTTSPYKTKTIQRELNKCLGSSIIIVSK